MGTNGALESCRLLSGCEERFYFLYLMTANKIKYYRRERKKHKELKNKKNRRRKRGVEKKKRYREGEEEIRKIE